MSAKLFIGSISPVMTEADLRDLFSKEGEVASIQVIIDKATGQSKGIALVEMVTERGASKVIRSYHGQEIEGRMMTVNVARGSDGRPSFKPKGRL